MKTKKKQIIGLSIIFSTLVILSFSIGGAIRLSNEGYSRVLNTNWGITLPSDAHCLEIYESDTGVSFNGDGLRYHVFSYENSSSIEHLLEWSEDDRSTIFYSTQIEAAKNWLMDLNVPDEWKPDYENSRYYYCSHSDNSELIIFWNAENELLHVVESFL